MNIELIVDGKVVQRLIGYDFLMNLVEAHWKARRANRMRFNAGLISAGEFCRKAMALDDAFARREIMIVERMMAI